MSGTLKVTTLQDGASSTANMTFDSSGNATVGGTIAMASSFKRNRIINGNMVVDQRNAGASITPVADQYGVDRFNYYLSQSSKFTAQQNGGSVTPPAGFTNYMGLTVGASANVTVSAGDYFGTRQMIEGYNVSDLGWGSANAKTITLSFWVRCSLTGTMGGALSNAGATRSYPFSYTINAANTWEQKTITIAGDTTGTWNTTTGIGIEVRFTLGAGSTYTSTANVWAAGNYTTSTGATNIIATNGATFYITGVQLEVGTKATPYEMQIYSDQLAQCQRYYWKTYNQSTVPGAASSTATYRTRAYVSSYAAAVVQFPVLMRTTPTVTLYNPVTGGTNSWYNTDASTSATAGLSTVMDSAVVTESSSVTTNNSYFFQIVASAEL